MRVLAMLLLLFPGGDAWEATLREIAAIRDGAEAIRRVEALEKELLADGSTEAKVRHGELLVRAKVPRLGMMAKGAASMEAIALFEEAFAKEPGNVKARYLHARTCLALPAMFGRRDAGIASLRRLVAIADETPGAVPYVDVFLRLAKEDPATAEKTIEIGLRSFPGDERLKKVREDDAPADAAGAKERFHEALSENRLAYEALDRALAAGGKLHPEDHEYPLFRGLLRLWRNEAAGGAKPAEEAVALFERALELNPEDTRIYGWLGPLCYALGHAGGGEEMIARGERLMEKGVRVNPEQNLFGRAFAYRMTGTHPDRIEAALYRTLELCSGEPMNRERFLPGRITSKHRSCGDSKYAPFNRAGTLYWAGEFFRSRGDDVRAKDAYESARKVAAKWPYRKLLDERLAFLAGKTKKLSRNPVSCMLCHQR